MGVATNSTWPQTVHVSLTKWLAVSWTQLVLLYMKGAFLFVCQFVCNHFLRLEEAATQQPNCPTPLLYRVLLRQPQ